ncbi:MAG: hybrid sensor histidine kinase/response regulator [Chloroflexota bacterium]|nr:hybrid sensor histidine kinase/response regulator [Chloroflexota bacterium]
MTATILYIEDDAGSRSLVERSLSHVGYRVVCAERGLTGIDLAQREQPDLILIDINLPDLTGREITTVLRADPRFKTTPIVALTAQTLSDYREMAFAAGMNGYLTKPLDVEALPAQVAYYLSGGRDQPDTAAQANAHKRHTEEIAVKLEARIRALENANADTRRLDAMKNSFIQLTAHELRTPLTLVLGYYRLLEDSPELRAAVLRDPALRGMMQGMSSAITRMHGMIGEILSISRIITNQIDLVLGPVSLGDIAVSAMEPYKTVFSERKLRVHFQRQDWSERMTADAELLKLALNNLLSNAIKYTPDGGLITLHVRRHEDALRFSVRDTGIGIAKEHHQSIFERFSTINNPEFHTTSKTAFMGGGLGLGLAICKGIIEAHGGRIWVESAGNDPIRLPGSEFIVVLPREARRIV